MKLKVILHSNGVEANLTFFHSDSMYTQYVDCPRKKGVSYSWEKSFFFCSAFFLGHMTLMERNSSKTLPPYYICILKHGK